MKKKNPKMPLRKQRKLIRVKTPSKSIDERPIIADKPIEEFYNDTLETIVIDRNASNYCKIVTMDEA